MITIGTWLVRSAEKCDKCEHTFVFRVHISQHRGVAHDDVRRVCQICGCVATIETLVFRDLLSGLVSWIPRKHGLFQLGVNFSLSQGSAPALHPMLVCTATSKREVLPPEITNRAPGSWFFKGWAGALDQGVTWGNSKLIFSMGCPSKSKSLSHLT